MNIFWTVTRLGVALILQIAYVIGIAKAQTETPKVVNQCYRAQGFSFVSLYCGYNNVIEIKVAYHGMHKNERIQHCGELQGDCTMETTDMYDWSKCEGKHSCVQIIKAKDMSTHCPDNSGVEYLQVEYLCHPLPGTETFEESMAKETKRRKKKKKKSSVEVKDIDIENHDICVNYTNQIDSKLIVHSPGHPDYYMANTDCRCAIQAKTGAKVAVTYHDLGLMQRSKQCIDWLLLQSPGHKKSTAVTCGTLPGNEEKTLMSESNWLLMHFHTANIEQRKDTALKKLMSGFKVMIQTVPLGTYNIKCYSVHPDILNSLKRNNKGDGSNDLILPASDLNVIASTGAVSSSADTVVSSSLTTWTLALTLLSSIYLAVFYQDERQLLYILLSH